MMKLDLATVLRKDREARQPGNLPADPSLHNLDSLNFDLSYDYSLPTLINSNDYNRAKIAHRSSEEFKDAFFKFFPLLAKVNLDNILIAGGSVGHYLTDKSKHSGDIDCFFYSISEREADKRIKKFIKDLFLAQEYLERKEEEERLAKQNGLNINVNPIQKVAVLKKVSATRKEEPEESEKSDDEESGESQESEEEYDEEESGEEGSQGIDSFKCMAEVPEERFKCKTEVQMIRNRSGLSIKMGYQIYQIIFRLYKSKSEVLHGFDLGPSAVGFDGESVLLTDLGKLSYESKIIVVDTTRRSTTYEHRIKKYFNRGFELVLPDLDFSKLRTGYHKYRVPEVCELPFLPFSYSSIIGNKIVLKEFLSVPSLDIESVSTDPKIEPSDYDLSDMDEYRLMYLNLYGLLHGGLERMYYFCNHPSYDILVKPPFLSAKSILYFYEKSRHDLLSDGAFNYKLVEKYITVASLEDIVKNTILSSIADKQERAQKVCEYLDILFKNQADSVIVKLEALKELDHSKIPWITENPGTQLTSSFNPIIDNANIWYGSTFKASIQ